MKLWQKIVLCVVIVLTLGAAGGWITARAIPDWYASLRKPPGTPPNGLFGPMWTMLYVAMGVAFALVWHRAPAGPPKKRAMVLFLIQFALNLAWTPLFFGAGQIAGALGLIVILFLAIALTIAAFRPLDRLAMWLLVPYLGWVGYATYLNAGFFWWNR